LQLSVVLIWTDSSEDAGFEAIAAWVLRRECRRLQAVLGVLHKGTYNKSGLRRIQQANDNKRLTSPLIVEAVKKRCARWVPAGPENVQNRSGDISDAVRSSRADPGSRRADNSHFGRQSVIRTESDESEQARAEGEEEPEGLDEDDHCIACAEHLRDRLPGQDQVIWLFTNNEYYFKILMNINECILFDQQIYSSTQNV